MFENTTIAFLRYKEKSMEFMVGVFVSGKKAKYSRPDYRGRLQIYFKNDMFLRPRRLLLEIKGRLEAYPPEEFIKMLRSSNKVLISEKIQENVKKMLLEMFKAYNIRDSKIRVVKFCPFCEIEGKVTVLETKSEIFKVQERYVCFKCAKDELLRELKFRGIRVSDMISERLFTLLRKVRSVDKLLGHLVTGMNIYVNPELTLFDKKEAKPEITERLTVEDLEIPDVLKNVLKENGIRELLPIQVKALKSGLLKGESILVVSATSTGKTLIGELPGVLAALNGKKMLYLCNLVALANQKYETFKARYSKLGLKVAIRVGMSKIDVGEEELVIVDEDVKNANIIVGTYEGLDYLIRSGQYSDLGDISVVIIDEIQSLSDEERGPELDGLIARIRSLFPKCQIIALSASVGNPEQLAQRLGLKLIKYSERPVPLERHLVICLSEKDKLKAIENMIKQEWRTISSHGFRGQTIIFTNSRRRAHQISNWLNKRGLKVATYHAGLTYPRRKMIELGFENGFYQAVTTTYALGAGFDAPASMVVFESLAQGINFITKSMFENMAGRAGRLGKHDRGRVVILVEPGKKYGGAVEETEDSMAIKLLEEELEPVEFSYDIEGCADQVLAYISAKGEVFLDDLKRYYSMLLGASENLDHVLETLLKDGMITMNNGKVAVTPLGRATAMSFYKLSEVKIARKYLKDGMDVLDVAILLEPFTQIYVSTKVQGELEKAFNVRFSSKLFSDAILDVMDVSTKKEMPKLPKWLLELFAKWSLEFFNCKCKEAPFCEHGIINLCKKIVKLRLEDKLKLREISSRLQKEYELYVYPGDLFRWLDSLIHKLKGISRLAKVWNLKEPAETAEQIVKDIEKPQQPNRENQNNNG